MLIKLLFIYISILPPIVHSTCYSKSLHTWICNDRYQSNTTQTTNLDYPTVLNNEKFEKFYLKNYQLSTFKIHNYPLTLQLLNASNNQFDTILITSKNRYRSNLRQLILQSNHLQSFRIDQISLPQSLEIISLANNQLEILDARMFLSLRNLTKLDLRNNQLKRILPQLLLNRNIRLDNNPLDCQCTPDFYRMICEKSTNLQKPITESNNCMAPYYASQPYDVPSSSYLRFSTFTLICPITGQPPPIIIWSTAFGNLTSINSSDIDLLSSDINEPIYVTVKASAGPLMARTRHVLHAFDTNHLSITQARASLQYRLSCSGISMLGTYTHKFDLNIDTFARKHGVWYLIYTLGFGLFMSLVAGALCVTLKRTSYYPDDQLKTPAIYPTMTTNSAARTPPNLELNQWLSVAAANISGTLEQVRDKLRLGVQHVSEQVGRASELFTHSVQQAGGTIRQAAETSAAYFQSIRETSQQRLNTIRVQTLSSLRSPGQFMRAGMNMLTTQVNSLGDYCGVTTGQPLATNYLLQQQQLHHLQNPLVSRSFLNQQQIPAIIEDDENVLESRSLINSPDHSPYAGNISSIIFVNTSGIGQLDTADNSALLALNNFNPDTTNPLDDSDLITSGQMSGGIGTFHDHNEELVHEPDRLIKYDAQRPFS